MKNITRTAVAVVASAALLVPMTPAQAFEADPYAYASQPHTVCGAIYANDVEGWSYSVEGSPFVAREESRDVMAFPGGTQSIVTATNAETGEERTFPLTVQPCIDWEAQARENAASHLKALAKVERKQAKIDRLKALVRTLRDRG